MKLPRLLLLPLIAGMACPIATGSEQVSEAPQSPHFHMSNSSRIDRLEIEVRNLKAQLLELTANPEQHPEPAAASERSKSIGNWKMLTTGMEFDEVRELLGEPRRVEGGDFRWWYYKNDGMVRFYYGKVDRWDAPRR